MERKSIKGERREEMEKREKEEIAKENQYKRKKREKKVQGITNDFDILIHLLL